MRVYDARAIRDDALWSFETARFFVGFYADPEEDDPLYSFEFPEDIEAVRSGAVDWFHASVRVFLKNEDDYSWTEIGSDHLGGCGYKSARSFAEGENRNGYFRDMVREAVAEARNELARIKAVPMREASANV